jgi:serine/threonine protein kinase
VRAPTPFGRQLLLERIAVGGMAEVFRAKSFGVEGFERVVAVKRILASMAASEEFVRMFVDEGRIASHLHHQNIVQIYELGKHDGLYYIAMEYVAGKDLRTLLDRQKKLGRPLEPAAAIHVIARVAEALDYAHRKRDPAGRELKIIHRDVSPQNVLVSYEGEVKLCDFGIAKAIVQQAATQVGVLKGKFAYMSPEQVRGRPIDRRSDLFALGVVFYELLTGERLFLGESEFATLEAVRSARVTPPSTFVPELDPRLEALVLRLLAREPDQRFAWASDFLEALLPLAHERRLAFHAHQLRGMMQEAYAADIRAENERLDAYAALGPELLDVRPSPEEPRSPRLILESLGVGGAPEDPASGPRVVPVELSLPSGVAPAGVAQHDDMSATVMHDDVSTPGALGAATIAQDDALGAQILEAQVAMAASLSVLGDGAARDDTLEVPDVPEVFEIRTVMEDPSLVGVEEADEPPTTVAASRSAVGVEPRRTANAARRGVAEQPPPPVFELDDGLGPPDAEPALPLGVPVSAPPPLRASPAFGVREARPLDLDASRGEGARGSPSTAPPPSASPGPARARPIVERVAEHVVEASDKTPPPATLVPASGPMFAPPVPAHGITPSRSTATAALPSAAMPSTAPSDERRARTQLAAALAALVALVVALLVALVALTGSDGASLRVDTRPTHAVELRLDGQVVARETPVEVSGLLLGEHVIEVRAEGYLVYRQSFTIQEERPHTLNIPLVATATVGH